ncbi:hypothetical protein ABZ805_26590 [Saccharopolyspora sp. NPDC047091]|uniref:hypothetical protein n=1 Tax=Saccharopolyspora sp. NPDC047091 TaxID=3155924 RepID=UPI0033F03BCA
MKPNPQIRNKDRPHPLPRPVRICRTAPRDLPVSGLDKAQICELIQPEQLDQLGVGGGDRAPKNDANDFPGCSWLSEPGTPSSIGVLVLIAPMSIQDLQERSIGEELQRAREKAARPDPEPEPEPPPEKEQPRRPDPWEADGHSDPIDAFNPDPDRYEPEPEPRERVEDRSDGRKWHPFTGSDRERVLKEHEEAKQDEARLEAIDSPMLNDVRSEISRLGKLLEDNGEYR